MINTNKIPKRFYDQIVSVMPITSVEAISARDINEEVKALEEVA